jgi:cobalt/nickel transport system permease protein
VHDRPPAGGDAPAVAPEHLEHGVDPFVDVVVDVVRMVVGPGHGSTSLPGRLPGVSSVAASRAQSQTVCSSVRPVHVPDGFIDGPTSAGAGIVAAGGVGFALRRVGRALDDRQVPLAGLVSAFVFAVQLLNFPVASGTSGHLLGGVLATVLVGPWLGAVCVAVVLLVQALLFADGGLTAIGLNVLNMALVTTFGGALLFVGLRRLLPRRPASVVAAAGIAGGLGVVLAALAFTFEYAVGGTGGASVGTVGAAMVGVHALIGIGEGVLTAMTVRAVLASRPDLVWGARDLDLRRPAVAVAG